MVRIMNKDVNQLHNLLECVFFAWSASHDEWSWTRATSFDKFVFWRFRGSVRFCSAVVLWRGGATAKSISQNKVCNL
jgi:hypothetical protein